MFWTDHLVTRLGLDLPALAREKRRRDEAESLIKGVFKRVFVQKTMRYSFSKQAEQKNLFRIHHNDTFHRIHSPYHVDFSVKYDVRAAARRFSDLVPEPWETFESTHYRTLAESALCSHCSRAY